MAISASLLLGSSLSGQKVFQKKCSQCHIEYLSKSETLQRFTTLKAPPMVEVASRLKANIQIANGDPLVKRGVVIAFIKHYIDNPNIDYSMCHPGAIDRFGIMPSLKGKLSAQEKEAVAAWIYDRFEGVDF